MINNTDIETLLREQAEEYERQQRKVSDFAFIFLNASNGDITMAERLLDDFVDLIIEAGVLSIWKYREVLNRIRREGL